MEQEAKCPFQPTINQKSAKMMEGKQRYSSTIKETDGLRDSKGNLEKPERIHERLYGLSLEQKKKPEEFPHHFHPEMNPNSEEIVNLMKQGEDYSKNERWKYLYEYGRQKQMERRELADKIKEIKENEELMNNTYRPEISTLHQRTSS